MRLYSGTSQQFIEDTIQNQIAEKLKASFFNHFRFYPSPGEINSWRNSLRSICQVFQYANLLDHGVILEYQLPLTSKRLDCLICGKDQSKSENAVIIELKQWDKCENADGENEVMTWVGRAKRDVLHPSVQVGRYQMYLEDVHTAFNDEKVPVLLYACSYLHNYNYFKDDVLYNDKFKEALAKYPLFTADDVNKLTEYLQKRLSKGEGLKTLKKIEESKYRPCKKLMDHVGNVIKGKSEYILLDEQLVIYDKVLACAKSNFHDKQKTVLIIKGGPGTGKSVIAINLMADLLLKGYNAHYATGSKAFTETLRKVIGARGSAQFKYFNSYSDAEINAIDVLIADESHRIRTTSNSRFTPAARRSNLPQIEELLAVSKVSVFFIDDNQVVRPNEIGSVDYIKTIAQQKNCKIYEYELEAQFRCNGSEAFVNWVNNTLGIKRTANVLWDQGEEFEFKIVSSPLELENSIRQKVKEGFTGRVTAGFCWDWSMPNPDGTLKDDVVIGDYRRPWDAKPEATRLAPGIPKASLWAYDPNGINQIGCVYTAQGFEFDYAGVIIGEDLVYDFDKQDWIGDPKKSSDSVVKRSKDRFAELLKNTYRVLLSRGMKGCYVYFMNKDTERFFKSRIEIQKDLRYSDFVRETKEDIVPLEILERIEDGKKYTEYLPVYSLAAACGKFGKNDNVESEPEGWIRTSCKNMDETVFVVRAVGHSMDPKIKDGSFCIFKVVSGGPYSGAGRVFLFQYQGDPDPETGGAYTIKGYRSHKGPDGLNMYVELLPFNKTYSTLKFEEKDSDIPSQLNFIAEFISVVK